jgi:3-hydroxy acid dehydrogenase/malonic semialdehyde reductase
MENLFSATVVVTGASSGFGAAIARLLAYTWPDARFHLIGRRRDRLEALAKEIGRSTPVVLDVRDRKAVEAYAAGIPAGEKIGVLVNNAGLAAGLDNFQDASLDDFERMIDTNVKGLLYMTRLLLPRMIAQKWGHVVNIGSVAGHQIYPKGHVYAATKFAVRAINDALRIDLLGTGVRVSSVDPGMAETEFSNVRFKGDDARANAVYKGMRPLSSEDVAEAVLWCLDRPAHVNIQDIVIMPTDQGSTRDVSRS